LAPQLCAYRGEEPGGYSQIEDYKGGSQEDPGLYGKVGEQVHGQSPSAILSFEFFFQLILLPFANLDLLASSSSAAVIQGVQPAVFTYRGRAAIAEFGHQDKEELAQYCAQPFFDHF
jgi:hypothetical protein